MTAKRFIRLLFLGPLLLALSGCLETGDIRPAVGDRWSEGRLPHYGPTAGGGAAETPSPALRVGLLLPLSGPYRAYGESLQNAATLALFENPTGRALEIMPRDTGGTEAGAGAAAVAALAGGAEALIGPATPGAAANVIDAANASATPVLMLAGDRRLAGPGAFDAATAPEAAATRIIAYAYRQGVRRFAALAPPTARGRAALRGAEAAAFSRRMTIARAELIGADAPGPALAQAVADALAAAGPDGAIFLPFPAEALPKFAKAFADAPLLLGLEDWDGGALLASPSFRNALYAGADPTIAADFRRRYAAAFGSPPVREAATVYDLTLMLAAAAARGGDRKFGAHAVHAAAGFVGVQGPFRVRRDGAVERRLAIVGVRDGRLTVIEAAPSSFGS